MLYSMTAFARRDLREPWGYAVWEIRSVNHRYLEMSLRLPEELRALEPGVRERINKKLRRGKVDCNLRLRRNASSSDQLSVNMDLARQLASAGREVSSLLDGATAPSSIDILRWPGVIESPELDLDAISATLLGTLDEALDILVETRQREGERLQEIISTRLSAVADESASVRKVLPEIIEAQRTRLRERFTEFLNELDPDRIEQEMAVLLQKMDVDEELDRLDTHVEEVTRVIKGGGAVGRRLDFLMQELHREANTLGAKSVHAATTRASVELKVLIEQMREQVQNIE